MTIDDLLDSFLLSLYLIPFVIVLMVSLLASSGIMKFCGQYFTGKYLKIFSGSILFIVATVISSSLAVAIPYRPIEFIGLPFWIPNLILVFVIYKFVGVQKQNYISQQRVSFLAKFVAIILLLISIILLVDTRLPYFEGKYKSDLYTAIGIYLSDPRICSTLSSRDQTTCVLKSLNETSSIEVNSCDYFDTRTDAHTDCIYAKAVRENNIELCEVFRDTSKYHVSYKYLERDCKNSFNNLPERWPDLNDQSGMIIYIRIQVSKYYENNLRQYTDLCSAEPILLAEDNFKNFICRDSVDEYKIYFDGPDEDKTLCIDSTEYQNSVDTRIEGFACKREPIKDDNKWRDDGRNIRELEVHTLEVRG